MVVELGNPVPVVEELVHGQRWRFSLFVICELWEYCGGRKGTCPSVFIVGVGVEGVISNPGVDHPPYVHKLVFVEGSSKSAKGWVR